jgi:hypothetical protein
MARAFFGLLHQHGPLDRTVLADLLGTNDRTMRSAAELCAKLAANPTKPGMLPEVVGFDPQIERYAIANSPQQADRIIAYQAARLRSTLERVRACADARQKRWPDSPLDATVQEKLFEGEEAVGRYSR